MGELVRLAKEALRRQQGLNPEISTPVPTIQPGTTITWTRADQVRTGVVDFLHTDDAGQQWVFVTQGSSWSAVNVKFAKRMSGGGRGSEISRNQAQTAALPLGYGSATHR